MSRLNRKLLRDLATHRAQVGAIIAVIALGIIMFTGPLLATRDLKESVNDIYMRTRYEDFSVRMERAPASAAAEVADIPNVIVADGRIVREAQARVKGRRLTVRVISVPDNDCVSVNGLLLENGSRPPPCEAGSCLVEHHLASELDLSPQTPLTIMRESGDVEFNIAGTVVSPEYLRLVRSRAEPVADPAQFGVIFVRRHEAESLFDMRGRIDDVVARVADKKSLQLTMDAAGKALEAYSVTGLTMGADEPGAATLNLEMQNIDSVSLFFSLLLLAVASLAVYITMTQIVFSQQRQIGVTRALGYGRGTISAHYISYGVILGMAGGVIGVIVGYFLSVVYAHIYANVFHLPLVQTSLHESIMLAGVAAGLAFSIAGALVPARYAVRMNPADAMRVEAGVARAPMRKKCKKGSDPFLHFWVRISFRNLLRNRRRTLLTWLGVIGTLCLFVTASGGKDSVDFAVGKYLHGVLRWDVAAVWKSPVGQDMLARVRAIDGVKSAEPIIDVPGRVLAGGKASDVQIQAYQANSSMHGLYPTAGSKAAPGPAEIVLNRGITSKLPVKQGSIVMVSTPVGSTPFRVAGFVSEPFGGVCYVNLQYVQALASHLTGEPGQFNGVVVTIARGRSSARAANAIRDLPDVAQVITKAGIARIFEELVGAVRTLFIIFYVMAFVMGFAVIFSMITVNFLERDREIATIRTLGAGKGMIFSFLTLETASVVVAALIPGIFLGRALEWVVIEKLLMSDRLAPDTVISRPTVIFIVVAALVVMAISELPSVRKLWRLDLARITKERTG